MLIKFKVGIYNYYINPDSILGFYVYETIDNKNNIYSVVNFKTVYGDISFDFYGMTVEETEEYILSVIGETIKELR